MSLNLSIRSATVPSPLDCIIDNPSWQALIALLSSEFPDDLGNFSKGNTEPPPSRRGDPWFRYDATGTPDGWYVYAMGAWLKRHTTAPGTVIMWEGVEADIPTFDGGEVGAVTEFSGPMWERVTAMDAKFPIGPGTLPSTTVIGIGDTGGEEKHELTLAETPEHNHLLANIDSPSPGGQTLTGSNYIARGPVNYPDDRDYTLAGTATAPTVGLTSDTGGNGTTGDAVEHNNIPPFHALWFLRRTQRLFYRL